MQERFRSVRHIIHIASSVVGIVFLGAVAGCAVGPDYKAPETPAPRSYVSPDMPAETVGTQGRGGESQRFMQGQDIPDTWWNVFHSPDLDRLVREALASNPTLSAAQATLRQSQEELRGITGAALYPRVDASAGVTRQKISGAGIGQPDAQFSPFTLYNASVNVTYALDLAGGARRELEALRAQVDVQQFLLEGAQLTITANVVTAAIREAALHAQIAATQDIIASEQKQLEVVERQFELGGVARTDVLAQRAQVAQTRALLPPLEKSLYQTRHQLAALIGKLPNDASLVPEFTLDSLTLPEELPLSLPSALAGQRPDIRASEALLHAASARIGVATANLYPQLNLSASLGSEAVTSSKLFGSGSGVWSVGGGLLQPLFHGGELKAKQREAVAVYDQAYAQYRSTVILAFQNVADVLRALEADARALAAQTDAATAAADSLDLAQKQFQLGAVSSLSLLNAERQYQQARIGLVQAQAVRFADTAALFQALGGGWWNRQKDDAGPSPKKDLVQEKAAQNGE